MAAKRPRKSKAAEPAQIESPPVASPVEPPAPPIPAPAPVVAPVRLEPEDVRRAVRIFNDWPSSHRIDEAALAGDQAGRLARVLEADRAAWQGQE